MLLGTLVAPASYGQSVPSAVPFNAALSFESGVPYEGTIDLGVSIHSASSGGAVLWPEFTFTNVDVEQGFLSVVLGGQGSPPLDASSWGSNEAWLEVRIDTVTLSPRLRIFAVPFAQVARTAMELGGVPASAYAQTADLGAVALSNDYGSLSNAPDLSVYAEKDNYAGAEGYLAAFSASGIQESSVFQGPTGVGIGVTEPAASLDVSGAIRFGHTNDCGAANEGSVRYVASLDRLELCNGAAWVAVGLGASGGGSSGSSGGNGQTQEQAALSCASPREQSSGLATGIYWIDPNGGSTDDAFQVHCEMNLGGGGFTLIATLSNVDGQRGWSLTSPRFANWLNATGLVQATPSLTEDYKSRAYSELPADDLMIVTDKGVYGVWSGLRHRPFRDRLLESSASCVAPSNAYARLKVVNASVASLNRDIILNSVDYNAPGACPLGFTASTTQDSAVLAFAESNSPSGSSPVPGGCNTGDGPHGIGQSWATNIKAPNSQVACAEGSCYEDFASSLGWSQCNTANFYSTPLNNNNPALEPAVIYIYVRDLGPYTTAAKNAVGDALASCKAIFDAGQSQGNGNYWIDSDGPNSGQPPYQAYCDMQNGGFTLLATLSNTDGVQSWSLSPGFSSWTQATAIQQATPNLASDYRSPAFSGVTGSALRVTTDRGLSATFSGLSNQSLQQRILASSGTCNTAASSGAVLPVTAASHPQLQRNLYINGLDENFPGTCPLASSTGQSSDSAILSMAGTITASSPHTGGGPMGLGQSWETNIKGPVGNVVGCNGNDCFEDFVSGFGWLHNTSATTFFGTPLNAGAQSLEPSRIWLWLR
jgi:hypothetical protein